MNEIAPIDDGKFLRELLAKHTTFDEVDVQRLRRLAERLTPASTPAGKDGLEKWAVAEWDNRPRQSGMEQRNEQFVLGLINLLSRMGIPFYILDERTKQKTGREYSTIERMEMLQRTYVERGELAKKADAAAVAAEQRAMVAAKKVEQYRVAMDAAIAELGDDVEKNVAAARTKVILENVEPSEETVKYGPPDDRGVRQVTLDARVLVLRLCMQRIVHDLAPNEAICTRCLGLGLIKDYSPFGLGDRKPHEDAFPYRHQWLRPCNECYMGKAVLCPHCRKVIPRHTTQCSCKEAQFELDVARQEKETERRKTLPRMSLAEYEHSLLWCDDADKFVNTDSVEDVLEEYPDTVFFACEPSAALTTPKGSDVMERLQEAATEEASPEDGEDVLEYENEKQAELELDTFFEKWAAMYVTARTLYYPNMKLIVEVPLGEADRADAVPDVRATDDAGGE